MSLVDFLVFGLDPITRRILYEQLPLYLLVFATIFLCIMVLLMQVAPGNPAMGVGAVIFAAAAAWMILQNINQWNVALTTVASAYAMPLLMVVGAVVFILVLVDMLL